MFKNFLSRFSSHQPAPSAPKAASAGTPDPQVLDFVQGMQEMWGAQPEPPKTPSPIHYNHPREKDEVPTEFKFATYRDGVRGLKVAYAIFHGNRCVFTQVDREGGSSINFGEDVAQVIARRERRPLESLRFYDLQTVTGYGERGMGGGGNMHFDEIILMCEDVYPQGIYIKSWIRTDCPEYVTELFREYVADSRPQASSELNSRDF